MQFVINCLGMPFNGDTLKHKSLGGSETAALQMAQELASCGHSVKIFTGITPDQEGKFNGVDYFSCGERKDNAPLGERFHFYAENTPHDVCIVQRHPEAFQFKFASKVNLWWVHDLSLHRSKQLVNDQMWNVDGVLCVSEFHKSQICDVYDIDPNVVFVLNNGVDPKLFDVEPCAVPESKTNMVYISRPERGLSNFLKKDGILDKLGEEYHLHICAYDNVTPQMKPYYDALWGNAQARPNVTNHGALTTDKLYSLMKACDVMVYPTPSEDSPNFEEVSCIAMMEAMHCGLPVVTCKSGALPETCSVSEGIKLIDLNKDGLVNINRFVATIKALGSAKIKAMSEAQLKAAPNYSWERSAESLISTLEKLFSRRKNLTNYLCNLVRVSDIFEAKKTIEDVGSNTMDRIFTAKAEEVKQCYSFLNDMGAHYENFYQDMASKGEGPREENLANSGRFNVVSSVLDRVKNVSGPVLDYGCGHGHYTLNLAAKYPERHFVGVDISANNIEFAKAWADRANVKNVEFICGESGAIPERDYDAIICAEVLEHVEHPAALTDTLAKYLRENGQMIITTPYGSWEAESYNKRYPFREHLWHFENKDLDFMFGMHDGFDCLNSPCGMNSLGDHIGSYITTFKKPTEPSKEKIHSYPGLIPKQTLSLMMMLRDCETTLLQSLRSVGDIVNEVVIGIDPTTKDFNALRDIVSAHCDELRIPYHVFKLSESPIDQGFGPARNEILNKCFGDWVLTLDSDEVLVNGNELKKYLRNNQFNGYAIKQHHFSNDPVGVLKTDFPCKIFRRDGMKFTGFVHEHPEADINEGVGKVDLLPDVSIAHYGYDNEEVRRKRFARNLALMKRDREENPHRKLSKMLWIRDLFQLCKYEMEQNGGQVMPHMLDRVEEGRQLWQELVEEKDARLAIDSLDFLTELNKIKGDGFWHSFSCDVDLFGNKPKGKEIVCYLHSKQAAKDLFNLVFEPKIKHFKSRYL